MALILMSRVTTRVEDGLVSAEAAVVVRRQIKEGRAFRCELAAYWQACERAADADLEGLRATQTGKGSPRRTSPRRLRSKSRD